MPPEPRIGIDYVPDGFVPITAMPWPLWLQVAAFALAFAFMQTAWSFAQGTVIERVAVDHATVIPAAWLLNLITPAVRAAAVGTSIRAAGGGINVLNGCEGFEILFLLAAGLLVAPMTWRRRLPGLFVGTLFVWLLNQARIVVLFYAYRTNKDMFALLHGTVAPLVMIVFVTIAFVLYLSPVEQSTRTPS
jgi:exosortase/archaeosortase family protein